jgi:hypothetical protein
MSDQDDRPPRARRVLAALAVTVVIAVFIALHLTGVLGPGSH